jgi:hypothetical protein
MMADSKNLDIELDPVESACVSGDAARLIEQLEEWFQMKRDDLEQYKGTESLVLGDQKITDPKIISGFKIGLHIALMTFGETLPISVNDEDGE